MVTQWNGLCVNGQIMMPGKNVGSLGGLYDELSLQPGHALTHALTVALKLTLLRNKMRPLR